MCNCVEKINELIKAKGERIAVNLMLDGSPTRPFIPTLKLSDSNKKGKVNLIVEFCPFCGQKYVV